MKRLGGSARSGRVARVHAAFVREKGFKLYKSSKSVRIPDALILRE